jgi:hypothetical protein
LFHLIFFHCCITFKMISLQIKAGGMTTLCQQGERYFGKWN